MSATPLTNPNSAASRGSTSGLLVSVIIPAYKIAPFVVETLDSVLAQTLTEYEIIVINDGSPDTEELERQIEPYSHLITYLKQSNQGAGAARNAGIRAARGEFAAFLDGDDTWRPDFLSEQVKLLRSDGGYDFVYADAVNFSGSKFSRTTNMEFNPSFGPVTAESLISGRCNIVTSSVVVSRSRIVDAGYFDTGFPNSQDFDLWIRLAKDGARITYHQKVLVHRRVYEGSLASNPIKSFEGEIKVLEKTQQRQDLTAEERLAVSRTLKLRRASVEVLRGKQQLAAGDFSSALATFRNANQHSPSWKLRLVIVWLGIAPRLLQRVYQANVPQVCMD
jgi:glycosyltransferase involved in cell wall biosynthesis